MHTNSMNYTLGKYDSGQTLIEIVLALSVAVAVITGITFAVTSSLTNATFTKNQNLATTYAQQGMETVRAIRDRSWSAFFSVPGGPFFCLPENSTDLVNRSGLNCDGEGNVGIFIREIRLNNNSPDCTAGFGNTKATVLVQWSDSKCTSPGNPFCHRVELVSCFTNINFAPIP